MISKASKAFVAAALSVTLASLFGCSSPQTEIVVEEPLFSDEVQMILDANGIDASNMDFGFTDKDLETGYSASSATLVTFMDGTATIEGEGAIASGTEITVNTGGTYLFSGEASNGQIIVDSDEDVQIVLYGCVLTRSDGPGISAIGTGNTYITLADGTDSAIYLGEAAALQAWRDSNYIMEGITVDAILGHPAIEASGELTVNGAGRLYIDTILGDGIDTGSSFKMTGGSLIINSIGDALASDENIKINGGVFEIISDQAGIRTTERSESDDATTPYVFINDGDISITSMGSAISSNDFVRIAAGNYKLTSIEEAAIASDDVILIEDGTFEITSQSDAIGATDALIIEGGNNVISGCENGLSSKSVYHLGGFTQIDSRGNSINATLATDKGSDRLDCIFQMLDGSLVIDAEKNGIYSDGRISVDGGVLLASGSTDAEYAGMTYGSDAEITGGSVIITGMAANSENFTSGTTPYVMVDLATTGESTIEITTKNDDYIASCNCPKAFESLIIAGFGLQYDTEYKISAGGNMIHINIERNGVSV